MVSEKIICLNTRKARKKSEKLGTKVEIYMDYAGLSFCQALSKALKEVEDE